MTDEEAKTPRALEVGRRSDWVLVAMFGISGSMEICMGATPSVLSSGQRCGLLATGSFYLLVAVAYVCGLVKARRSRTAPDELADFARGAVGKTKEPTR